VTEAGGRGGQGGRWTGGRQREETGEGGPDTGKTAAAYASAAGARAWLEHVQESSRHPDNVFCRCAVLCRVWPVRLLHPGTSRQQSWQRHRKQVCWRAGAAAAGALSCCSGSRSMLAAAGRMQQ
jgi:hypothetical protein